MDHMFLRLIMDQVYFVIRQIMIKVGRSDADAELDAWIEGKEKQPSISVNGDIVISLDTVRSNAELFGRPYDEELHRVIIHGVLHLCGINDKGPGEREIMEAAENKALAML